MSLQIQYDFFETKDGLIISNLINQLTALQEEVNLLKQSHNKVRRGTYASLNEEKKLIVDAVNRLEIIERNICQKKEA